LKFAIFEVLPQLLRPDNILEEPDKNAVEASIFQIRPERVDKLGVKAVVMRIPKIS
jgi:hypothetical protein